MNSLLLEAANSEVFILDIAIWIVAGAIGVIGLVAGLWRFVLMHRYLQFNKVDTSLTASETASKMLEGLGITDVQVVKCGFWSGLVFGNSYSPRKKIIRLRKNIFDKRTLTAVTVATQKVALAKMDHDGDKRVKTRSVLATIGYFAPYAFVPLFIVGLIFDLFVFKKFGLMTLIFSGIGFVFFLVSFIVICLNMKVEKKASEMAYDFIEKTGVLKDEELEDAQYLYKTYNTLYVLDFVYSLLYLIWYILKFIRFVLTNKKQK